MFAVFVYILLLVVAVQSSRKFFGSGFNPVAAMAGIWLPGLALAESGLVHYNPLDFSTRLLYLGSLGTFSLGAILVWSSFRHRGRVKVTRIEARDLAAQMLGTIFIMTVLVVVGAVLYYAYVDSTLGLDVLLYDPRSLRYEESYGFLRRADSQLSPFAIFRSFSAPLLGLTCGYLQVPMARYKWIVALVSVALVLLLSLNSGRTALIGATAMGLATTLAMRVAYQLRPLSRKQTTIICSSIVVLCMSYFVVTSRFLEKDVRDVHLGSLTNLPESMEWLVMPVHYYASPFIGFQEMRREPSSYIDNGSLTWGFFSTVLSKIWPNDFRYPEYIQPFCETPLPTNVYTYLDGFFIDYGYFGVFTCPLVIGAGVTLVYAWWLRRRNVEALYVLGILGYAVVSSFMVNRFSNFETVLWIVVGTLAISAARLLSKIIRDAVLAKSSS